jgi:hypothetical protein
MNGAPRFDRHLARVPLPFLQDAARAWGIGVGKFTSSECVKAILQGLKDDQRIQSLIRKLQPYERAALEIAKEQGGRVATRTLMIQLPLLGIELPDLKNNFGNNTIAFAHTLLRSGLFVPDTDTSNPLNYGLSFDQLITDERILSHIGQLSLPSIALAPTTAPETSSYRRPASIVLTILGFMKAIADLGGIKLTKAGVPQVSALRKLMKSQKWEEDGILIDGFWFPQPTLALTSALFYSRALVVESDESLMVLAQPLEAFASRPYLVQIGQVMLGFSITSQWAEWNPSGGWFNQISYIEARQILLLVLKMLQPDAWYSLDELSDFLFEGIGDSFSITGYTAAFRVLKAGGISQAEILRQAKERHYANWQQQEKKWLRYALATWLYWLGVVELGWSRHSQNSAGKTSQTEAVISFRVTEMGHLLLDPKLETFQQATIAPQPIWIVQPNFEILVYLDQAVPSQMIFLDRCADRIDLQQHTAQYKLTRESVYRGLEQGASLEDFLDELRTGAKVPLPQNVETDLQQWGELREQVTLRRATQILEFSDAKTAQAAAQELKGKLMGDRFVLTTQNTSVNAWVKKQIDYTKRFESCLTISEIGEVKQTKPVLDLLLGTQLQRWMEKRSDNEWAITEASVKNAVQTGSKAIDILEFLEDRLTHAMPSLLEVAITAWAGRPAKLELEEVIILRIPSPEVFKAIATSDKLRSHFVGKLAPDLLLVKRARLKKLNQDLAWLGITPFDHLQID